MNKPSITIYIDISWSRVDSCCRTLLLFIKPPYFFYLIQDTSRIRQLFRPWIIPPNNKLLLMARSTHLIITCFHTRLFRIHNSQTIIAACLEIMSIHFRFTCDYMAFESRCPHIIEPAIHVRACWEIVEEGAWRSISKVSFWSERIIYIIVSAGRLGRWKDITNRCWMSNDVLFIANSMDLSN